MSIEKNDPFITFIDSNLRKLKKKIKIDTPTEEVNEEEFEKKLDLFNKLISDTKNLPLSFIIDTGDPNKQKYLMEIALEEKVLKIYKKFKNFYKINVENKSKENIKELIIKIRKETNWEKTNKRKFYTQIDKIEIKDNENKMDDIPYFVDYLQSRVLNGEHTFKSLSTFLPEWTSDGELDNIRRQETNNIEEKIKKNKSLINIYDMRSFKENKPAIKIFMRKYINSLDLKAKESKENLLNNTKRG